MYNAFVHVYILGTNFKTCTFLKPFDGYKMGKTVLKQAQKLQNRPDSFKTCMYILVHIVRTYTQEDFNVQMLKIYAIHPDF